MAAREGFEPSHGFTRLTPQQGVPFGHLGTSPDYVNYEIKKREFTTLGVKNFSQMQFFVPYVSEIYGKGLPFRFASHQQNLYAFLCWLVDSIEPQVTVRNTTPKPTRQYYIIRHHASCAEGVVCTIGGSGRNRTSDTWIFSPLLLPAELLTHIQDTNEIFVGVEPTTHCLSDNCSTR